MLEMIFEEVNGVHCVALMKDEKDLVFVGVEWLRGLAAAANIKEDDEEDFLAWLKRNDCRPATITEALGDRWQITKVTSSTE